MFLSSHSDLLHLQLFLVNVIPKLATHLFSPPALCVTYTSCNSTPLFSSTCNRAFAISCLSFAVFVCFVFPLELQRGTLGGSHLSAGRLSETVVSWVSHRQNLLSNPLRFPFREPLLPKILSSLPGSWASWWNTQWVSSSASRPPENGTNSFWQL